jgi:HK97 family phage prohead protease
MQPPIERRSTHIPALTREENREGKIYRTFNGTAIVYGEYSEIIFGFREINEPRAAKRAVAENDVRANQNHDDNYVLGRTKGQPAGPNGEPSLVLTEDDKGVHVVNYPPDTTYANNLAALLARGDIDSMSYQFRVPSDGEYWDGDVDAPVRHVTEIYPLYDVAFVVYPAYPQSSASVETVVRSAGVDYDALRLVYSKTKLGLPMTEAEAKFSANAARWMDESSRALRGCAGTCSKMTTSVGTWTVPIPGEIIDAKKNEELEGARVRELDLLRMQLDCIRLSLRTF